MSAWSKPIISRKTSVSAKPWRTPAILTAVSAVAYNEAGKPAILVIQPEERLKRIIVDAVKK